MVRVFSQFVILRISKMEVGSWERIRGGRPMSFMARKKAVRQQDATRKDLSEAIPIHEKDSAARQIVVADGIV
jgi:hypothetical protein